MEAAIPETPAVSPALTVAGVLTLALSAVQVLPFLETAAQGTLAAAEFVTRADMIRQAISHGLPLGGTKAFQIVIGARLNHGVVVSLSYRNHAVLR